MWLWKSSLRIILVSTASSAFPASGSNLFTTLDLFSGDWKIHLSEKCNENTTFICRFGTLLFEVIAFGLMNAPLTSQQMMDRLFGELSYVRVYLDNVVVFSKSMDEHAKNVRTVLEKISKHKL